jgi:hypothetical protein
MIIKATAYIKNGRVHISKNEQPAFLMRISKLKNQRAELQLIIGKKRTIPENNYYWGCIVEMIMLEINEQWGETFSKNDIHEFLKNRFLDGVEISNENGEIISIRKSTKDNTTTMQEEYHENCRRFAKDFLNLTIPLPNEQLEIEIN